jgi:hypothetical protein
MVAGDTSKKNVENIQTRIAEKRLTSTGKSKLMNSSFRNKQRQQQQQPPALLLSLGGLSVTFQIIT